MQQAIPPEGREHVIALNQFFAVLQEISIGHPALQPAQRPTRDSVAEARLHSLRLSKRERDCLHLIAEGKSNGQIADELGLAIPTVATHIDRARAKLQAKTRAQAVAHYMLACLL